MKNTKLSICNTKAQILKSMTIEQILLEIKGTKHKNHIEELRIIKRNKGKDSNEFKIKKEQLLGFTPSGIFQDNRSKDNLITDSYSSLCVLDIDDLTDSEHVNKVVTKVKEISYTLAAFRSPSGNGCKILVRMEAQPETHKKVYIQLMEFYNSELLSLKTKCDEKCSDLSRFHYFSYDPSIYINWKSEVFIPKSFILEDKKPISHHEDKIKQCEKLTQNKLSFKGGRNNFVHLLACNFNRYGISIEKSLDYIISKYEEAGFNNLEIISIVKGVYSRNKNEFYKFREVNKESELKKKYDHKQIRKNLELDNLNFNDNDYFSLIFQSNESENIELLNYLLLDLEHIYFAFTDKTLLYFAMQIISNPNFTNEIFKENNDDSISSSFETLLDSEITTDIDLKRRILIADFKAHCLDKVYRELLKKQPFIPKQQISNSFQELNEIAELYRNHIKTSKSLLEDFDDNSL